MSFFVFSDFFYVIFGAFIGAFFGPELNGPLWGGLISFVFGKLIQLGPRTLNHYKKPSLPSVF